MPVDADAKDNLWRSKGTPGEEEVMDREGGEGFVRSHVHEALVLTGCILVKLFLRRLDVDGTGFGCRGASHQKDSERADNSSYAGMMEVADQAGCRSIRRARLLIVTTTSKAIPSFLCLPFTDSANMNTGNFPRYQGPRSLSSGKSYWPSSSPFAGLASLLPEPLPRYRTGFSGYYLAKIGNGARGHQHFKRKRLNDQACQRFSGIRDRDGKAFCRDSYTSLTRCCLFTTIIHFGRLSINFFFCEYFTCSDRNELALKKVTKRLPQFNASAMLPLSAR
ncbi:hypothetical protein F5146DRAFT_1125767 [Armillaria mellea]|nr:hypothetical protein F5146DRAFT_1125767 [Armillaria mellea]